MPFSVDPIVLSDEVRAELEHRVRAHRTPQRVARRARIVLLCADGVSIRQIAVEVDMDQHQVGVWRKRFIADGLDGLDDQPRSGRPRRIGHDDRLKLAAVATSEKDDDDPIAVWTYQDLADALFEEGTEISASQVGRILNAMHIDVTRVRGWLNRRDDPDFWARVRDVCGVYLNCPDDAIVLSVDEKTSVQAKERKHKDRPPRSGWLGAHQRYTTHATLGTIRMGARLYDPTLGRFHQQDPIEAGSCNDYDYTCADPINGLDLNGQWGIRIGPIKMALRI